MLTNECVCLGTLPLENASSSKQVPKKENKKTQYSSFKATESFTSSGELYDYLQKGKVDPKAPKGANGKKIVTLLETPRWAWRRKNVTISLPHRPPSSDTEDDAKTSFEDEHS